MAKLKNAEQAKEALPGLREDRKVASKEYKQFMKENSLKIEEDGTEDFSDHKTHGKKWTKLRNQLTTATKAVEEAQKLVESGKEEKEKKSGGTRKTVYTYPDDMSPEDKKKFRAKKRAEAKKAEKDAAGGKEEKPSKKDKKKAKETEEAPAKSDEAPKKDKSKKKDKKKSEKAED